MPEATPTMDRDAEIDQINRELVLLRDRHAAYARAAAIMKAIFAVLIPLAGLAALAFAVKLFLFDPLYGAFFVGGVAVFVMVAIWFVGAIGLRWIDFVSGFPRGILNPYFLAPDIPRSQRARSDAEMIERQIAGRERRLAELGAGGPPRTDTSIR